MPCELRIHLNPHLVNYTQFFAKLKYDSIEKWADKYTSYPIHHALKTYEISYSCHSF